MSDQNGRSADVYASEYVIGPEGMDIARSPLTQPALAERFWAIDGNVHHVDPTITRFGPLKPAVGFADYDTPVPALLLTGSGTHPVAGISGMPGQNCARRVLHTLGGRRGLGTSQRASADDRHAALDSAGAADAAPEEKGVV